jgi:hypothetical protein
MPKITAGRHTAVAPDGTVVLLIGSRINNPWKPQRWVPFFAGMVRMLKELSQDKEKHGFLGYHLWFGRTTLVVQYWRSMDDLLAYSRAQPQEHVPVWRLYNRASSGELGVFHEAYTINRGSHHVIYRNMPAFGLGAATETGDVLTHRGTSPTEWTDEDRVSADQWGGIRA